MSGLFPPHAPAIIRWLNVTGYRIRRFRSTSDNPCYVKFDVPHIYSHKGALGHSLGASGLVSVVLNCLMHRHGVVLPNVQTRTPIPMKHLLISNETVTRKIDRSLVIASGFGGAMGAVSLVSPGAMKLVRG